MHDRKRRHPRHRRRIATLALEALAETGVLQRRQQQRHHAATEEDAIPRTQRQHHVAGDRTERGAEHVDRTHAAAIAFGRARGDVLGEQRARIESGDLAQRAMQVHQARHR